MTTWTTPKTWTANTLSVSDMNTHVRDNLNHLYERAPVYVVYKSADESLNTSTTLQNDDALFWTVAANERWSFDLVVLYTSVNTTMDFKFGWSVPASTTIKWATFETGGIGFATVNQGTSASSGYAVSTESTAPVMGSGTGINQMTRWTGVVFVAGTGGTVNFQWAQNTSNGSNLTVQAGSYLLLTKLA